MRWDLAEHDAGAAERLADEAGIRPLIARLLAIRGITDIGSARAFLTADLSGLSDPFHLSGMAVAVDRVRSAIRRSEPIVIYGDYDVDGVTGSAVLFLALTELGAKVSCYIPDRMTEGYGLNTAALRKLRDDGAQVVITVDCGISAFAEAAAARDLGLDLIITDHHESAAVPRDGAEAAGEVPPPAAAVLHPGLTRPDAPGAVREGICGLTGVGVAFKLAQALLGRGADDPRIASYLDLVTLGTVADMGRLRGENRILVRHGLQLLSAGQEDLRPGIAALKQAAGIAGRPVTAGTVGFTLAPRINASGRLERADAAFRLLTTRSAGEAQELAAMLDAVNRERQAVEEGIWQEARAQCLGRDLAQSGALVLASDGWHPGVIGIVASRIVDEFYRPTALIALKDGVGKGSARSIPGFDLYQGLTRCSDFLLGFGGHKYAAGLTIAEDRIPLLRERLNAVAREELGPDGFTRAITIDAPVGLEELDFGLLEDLERMAPFGQGNPEPRLGAKGLEVLALRPVGNNRHLKLRLRQGSAPPIEAIAYGKAEAYQARVRTGSRIAAVFTPRVNTWNGMRSIEMELRDIKVEANPKFEIRSSK